MSQYHEPPNEMSDESRDITRALISLKEEIEAIDWYNQRIENTSDEALKDILSHNRDEEIEHACMAIEWLRRNMPGWDENMKTYFFKEGDITELEDEEEGDQRSDLGLGKLKKQ